MSLKGWAARQWARRRAKQIARVQAEPVASQRRTLAYLLDRAKGTAFGQAHSFAAITQEVAFKDKVPVRDYEAVKAYFDRIAQGEPDVSWPGRPLYLAKTSGTTSGAKYIPLTKESMPFQLKGARDSLLLYIHATGNARFLDGKMMFLSGSPALESHPSGLKVGRLSGIVNHYIPTVLKRNQTPDFQTNCIEDWEKKLDAVLKIAMKQDLRLVSGIPPWVQMLFERLEEKTGKLPRQQWPNLGLFVQGGVDYRAYQAIFDRYLGSEVDTLEVFPASEGFFGIQGDPRKEGMLLNLDYGIYYEFVPMSEYGNVNAPRLRLDQVELGVDYALIVSTNAGLWAYDIGDTVRFISRSPYRLKVSGRTKHFISAFGEHVIAEEVTQAMLEALKRHGGKVWEFTVAPKVAEEEGESHHEWLAEFDPMPEDPAAFAATLDGELRKRNSYYDDLRKGNMLRPAVLSPLKMGASRAYMKAKGKLGGQNKFPRLSNHREIADWMHENGQLLSAVNESH